MTIAKRRLFNIGPGLKIAIVLTIVIVGYKYLQVQKQIDSQERQPPIIERPLITSSAEKLGPTPEVSFIIDRRAKLGLRDDQVKKLRQIDSDWQRIYSPKLDEAKAAAEKANSYLSDAKGSRKTPVAQIQNEARPMIALSGEISSARREYWEKAVKLLTPEQQTALQKEREADWAAKKAKGR